MNTLTATRHNLDFNLLSPEKFAQLGYWLVEDLREYKAVDYYEGSRDKGRDVIGITYDDDLDYFQCKRYQEITYSTFKEELDKITKYVKDGEIKSPRRIYFVTSSSASPESKDRAKTYAKSIGLPEPDFWGPIVLDKKIKNSTKALKNFFSISEESEDLAQVDVNGLIATGTHESRFVIVNNGDVPAVDCNWKILGFAWGGYLGVPRAFSLNPQAEKELRIAMQHDFMKNNPIRELRLRFEYRDAKNNWFYSERFLNVEMVPSGAFFRIHPEPGEYTPAQPLLKFSVDSIEPYPPTGVRTTFLIAYTYNRVARDLTIELSFTLQHGVWKFNVDETQYAIRELAERKISQMIIANNFEEKFVVNSYLKPSQLTGFEAYKELRDSIL